MFQRERNGALSEEKVPASILQLLGSSNLSDALSNIVTLQHNSQDLLFFKAQNNMLVSKLSELALKNMELSENCVVAESNIQELTQGVADLECVLKEAEIQLSVHRSTVHELKVAHSKEYDSMRADLLWEIDQTKKIAAEEILNYSKQLSSVQSLIFDHNIVIPQIESQTNRGSRTLAMKTGSSRILRLSHPLSFSSDSIKLPAVDDSSLELDSGGPDSKNVALLRQIDQLNSEVQFFRDAHNISCTRLLEMENAKQSLELKCVHSTELFAQKCTENVQLQSRIQLMIAEHDRLSEENDRLNKTQMESGHQTERFHRRQELTVKNLMGKAISRLQHSALDMAWTKWKDETRKSNLIRSVVKRMLKTNASRSFHKWSQVVQESKFSKYQMDLAQKSKDVEQLIQEHSLFKEMSKSESSRTSRILEENVIEINELRVEIKNLSAELFKQKELQITFVKRWNDSFFANVVQKVLTCKLKFVSLKVFEGWQKVLHQSKLSKLAECVDQKSRETEQLHLQVRNMTEELVAKKEQFRKLHESFLDTKVATGSNVEVCDVVDKKLATLEKEKTELRRHAALLQSQSDDVVSPKDSDATVIQEILHFRGQITLLKERLDDSDRQLVAKDSALSASEERIQTQSSAIISLESIVLEQQRKHSALEKEIALGAAHYSLLFKELKETRSKLTSSSEELFRLQEQHFGIVERLDGTSGSIQALWKERESELEDLSVKLSAQQQLYFELQTRHDEQEHRIQDVHLESMHMHALHVEQYMHDEEKQRTSVLLLEARNELLALQQIYDEDMLEVQGLSKVLQMRIFCLQEELSQLKGQDNNKVAN